MELNGAVCVVTGASSGIGRAIALAFAGRGSAVVAVGRNRAALEEVAGLCGGRLLAADLREPAAAAQVVAETTRVHGRIDVLVNNAGAGWAGNLADTPPEVVERLVATNLLAPIRLCAAALPDMLRRRSGHVVNVASIVAFTGNRQEAVYAGTKSGLAGFTHSLAQELAGTGVGTSLVVPGVIATPFFDRRGQPYRRTWPGPLPPERVASAAVAAVLAGRREVFVPAWMRLPARLSGAAPGLYRALATRFG